MISLYRYRYIYIYIFIFANKEGHIHDSRPPWERVRTWHQVSLRNRNRCAADAADAKKVWSETLEISGEFWVNSPTAQKMLFGVWCRDRKNGCLFALIKLYTGICLKYIGCMGFEICHTYSQFLFWSIIYPLRNDNIRVYIHRYRAAVVKLPEAVHLRMGQIPTRHIVLGMNIHIYRLFWPMAISWLMKLQRCEWLNVGPQRCFVYGSKSFWPKRQIISPGSRQNSLHLGCRLEDWRLICGSFATAMWFSQPSPAGYFSRAIPRLFPSRRKIIYHHNYHPMAVSQWSDLGCP